MIADYFFLLIIFFLGVWVSYQDFKYGKIRNKWIILSLILGFVIYSILVAGFFFSPSFRAANGNTLNYLESVLINSFFALIIGYFIWYFNLWSAGDAKLFFALSFLLPLKYYSRSYFPYFPSFALLVNSFIPALAFLMMWNIYLLIKKIDKKNFSIKEVFKLAGRKLDYVKKNYLLFLKSFFAFFLILIIFQIFGYEIGRRLDQSQILYLLLFLLVFVAAGLSRKILEKTWALVFIFCLLAVYLIGGGFSGFFIATTMIKNSVVVTAVFLLAAILLSYKPAKETLQQKIPFAVWLFLGVVITIILQGSLISFLLNPDKFWR